MQDKQTIIRYGLIGAVALLIIAGLLYMGLARRQDKKKTAELLRQELIGQAQSTAPEAATSTPTSTPETIAPQPAQKKAGVVTASYADALQKYRNGYRIQFSECRGIPGKLVVKSGVSFMLDNRDGVWHEIMIGKQRYKLSGWGYAITSVKNVGTYNITCDGGGSAELVIEP